MGRTCLIVVSRRVESLTGIAEELAHAVSLARTEEPIAAAYLTMRESRGHSNNTNTSPSPGSLFFRFAVSRRSDVRNRADGLDRVAGSLQRQ